MIEQYALYIGENALESDAKKVLDYPEINIITKNRANNRYVIVFEHNKVLSKQDFGLSGKWIVSINKNYTLLEVF